MLFRMILLDLGLEFTAVENFSIFDAILYSLPYWNEDPKVSCNHPDKSQNGDARVDKTVEISFFLKCG